MDTIEPEDRAFCTDRHAEQEHLMTDTPSPSFTAGGGVPPDRLHALGAGEWRLSEPVPVEPKAPGSRASVRARVQLM